MMPEYIIVDSNFLLRILTGEPEPLVSKAKKLLIKSKNGGVAIIVLPIVIAETVYTLKSFYKIGRKDIAKKFLSLLKSYDLQVEDYDTIIDAFIRYQNHNVDFEDAYLAAVAYNRKQKVASFDRDLRKFSDIECVEL